MTFLRRRATPTSSRILIPCPASACVLGLLCGLGVSTPAATAQTPALVEFSFGGVWKRGLQLVELSDESVVIGQDGWLHSLEHSAPGVRVRKVDGRYVPQTPAQMRAGLQAEFGPKFEVVSTAHFLVVQPRQRGNLWPELFEQSHRAFLTFMQKRGVRIRKGRFPMVAVVFPDSVAMYREFKRLEIDISRVSGVYANSCNRVMTHDGGQHDYTAATVRHEAAHQSAFNTGVHSRVNDTPKWITEGIGQLFEPPAMTRQAAGTTISERVNHESMAQLEKTFPDRNGPEFTRCVRELITNDMMFADARQISRAYAVSWSMMFYLAERQPRKFAELLRLTSTRPAFRKYTPTEKIADFKRVMGIDPQQFAMQISWFLETAK